MGSDGKLGDIRLMKTVHTLFPLLFWSLKLDWEFLFIVPNIPWFERFRIIICKYLLFLRDRCLSSNIHQAIAFGRNYKYNDLYGLGAIQRVYCSSWKLKELLPSHPVVVDVGANLGQFNLFSHAYLGAERIISIEPLQSCYLILKENSENHSECINALIGEKEEDVRFFVAKNSQLSSTVYDNCSEYCDEVTIKSLPLDRILTSSGIEKINLLKIDTEGSEMDVLRSSGAFLDKTDVILVEMSVFRKNRGNMFDIGFFLQSKGFVLHELVFANGVNPTDVDGIFVRK
jgi:FkbM family methyltransferase